MEKIDIKICLNKRNENWKSTKKIIVIQKNQRKSPNKVKLYSFIIS